MMHKDFFKTYVSYSSKCIVSLNLLSYIILKRLINVTMERFGQIDCLVNNAGWRKSKFYFTLVNFFICSTLFILTRDFWIYLEENCIY